MADTSSKTMDKKNVLFPEGGGHAKLAMWSSIKGQLERTLQPLVDGDLGRMSLRDADALIRDALAKKDAVKDTYFKVGMVGTSLVLRVKSQAKGIAQILGYEQKDALLLKDCALKTAGKAAAAKVTEDMSFPSFVALAPGDCKPIVKEYLDIGDGYKITLTLRVEGADKDAGLRARVNGVHATFCKTYQDKAKGIADAAADRLSRLTVKSGTTLQQVAKETDAALAALFDDREITQAFEKAVRGMAEADSRLKQHVREWKIKGACKAFTTTVKLTKSVLLLVASHGAAVTAYAGIVECGYAIYSLIDDFTKKEAEAAAALDKAIGLYQASSKKLLAEMESIYAENRLGSGKVLSALKTLGDGAAMAQAKLTRAIKTYTGQDVAQQPEEVRRRYLVEVGKLLNALDAQATKLDRFMEQFKASSINAAVQAWPKLQALKKACADAAELLRERKKFAEDAKARIAALNIQVDDSTSLDKLKTLVQGVRQFDKDKVIGGAGTAASVALTARSAVNAVAELAKQVKAFA